MDDIFDEMDLKALGWLVESLHDSVVIEESDTIHPEYADTQYQVIEALHRIYKRAQEAYMERMHP